MVGSPTQSVRVEEKLVDTSGGELHDGKQIDQVREEDLAHDGWLVVSPHQVDEGLDGFLHECLVVGLIGQEPEEDLGIVAHEQPVHVKGLYLDSLQRLLTSRKTCVERGLKSRRS